MQRTKTKQNRWAGRWRAYCRRRLLEHRGVADFRQWARDYAVLSEAEVLELQRLNEHAIAQRRVGAKTSFGLNVKQTRRARLAAARAALAGAVSVGGRASVATVALLDRAAASGSTMEEAVRAAQASQTASIRMAASLQAEIESELRGFPDTDAGRESSQHLLDFLEGFKNARPIPGELGDVYELSPDVDGDIISKAKRVAALLAADSPQSRKLGPALDRFWKELCTTLYDRDCPAVSADHVPDSTCRNAGMCVCLGSPGRAVHDIRVSVYRALKAFAPRGSNNRALLVGAACSSTLLANCAHMKTWSSWRRQRQSASICL